MVSVCSGINQLIMDNFSDSVPEHYQVISHQVITGEKQGKRYCETLPVPFERDDSEFSGGVPIEKTNIDSLNLPCHKVYIL